MFKYVLLTLSLLVSMAVAAAPKVYHGDPVAESQYPFVVAVINHSKVSGSTHLCTGTLIKNNWILTARHCVYDKDYMNYALPSEMSVQFGVDLNNRLGSIAVKQVIVMDNNMIFGDSEADYKQFLKHDIALLKLAMPVSDITPVKLPDSPQAILNLKNSDMKAIEVGYGYEDIMAVKIKNKIEYMPVVGQLLQGDAIIKSDDMIKHLIDSIFTKWHPFEDPSEISSSEPYNPDFMIGVISPDQKLATNGDSGGPLLIKPEGDSSGQYFQVGVLSWGMNREEDYINSENSEDAPAIYINLTNSEILDFIKQAIKD